MDVHDHRPEKRGDGLGHGSFVGIGPDGDVDPGEPGDVRGPGAGGVDHDLGPVFGSCPSGRRGRGRLRSIRPVTFSLKRNSAPARLARTKKAWAAARGEAWPSSGENVPPIRPSGFRSGATSSSPVLVQPIDVQPVVFLSDEQVLEGLFLAFAIGGEQIAAFAAIPDCRRGALFPGPEDLEAPEADADLGRVGVGRPQSADGVLVRALAGAGELVDDERPQPFFGQEHGRRRSDAPGADDDDVEGLPQRTWLRLLRLVAAGERAERRLP